MHSIRNIEDLVMKELTMTPADLREHIAARDQHQTHFSFDDHDEPAGLCRNCDNKWKCLLPGRRNGVWHCEEYR